MALSRVTAISWSSSARERHMTSRNSACCSSCRNVQLLLLRLHGGRSSSSLLASASASSASGVHHVRRRGRQAGPPTALQQRPGTAAPQDNPAAQQPRAVVLAASSVEGASGAEARRASRAQEWCVASATAIATVNRSCRNHERRSGSRLRRAEPPSRSTCIDRQSFTESYPEKFNLSETVIWCFCVPFTSARVQSGRAVHLPQCAPFFDQYSRPVPPETDPGSPGGVTNL